MIRIPLIFCATFGGAVMLVACSSSSDVRDQASQEEDAGDGGASLSETGSPPDASPPVDGTTEKPPFDPKDEPVVCESTPCAVELVAGERHFCARMNDGTVRCWGDNEWGSLGVDDAGISNGPTSGDPSWTAPTVAEVTGATQISAGGTTACALVAGGIWCWGGNNAGQLGLGLDEPVVDYDRHPTPSAVALTSNVERIDVGPLTACAVLAPTNVWCWGLNLQRQLARASKLSYDVPASADLGTLAVARTALGTYTSFAVTDTREIVSWGAVAGAEGSVSGRESSLTGDPTPLPIGLGSVTSFAVSPTTVYRPTGNPMPAPQGIGHACAVAGGEVFCWGDTYMGALGSGFAMLTREPRRAVVKSSNAWPQQVAAAGDISCVRLTDGTVQCAGDNAFGALGKDPATAYSTVFEPVESLGSYAVAVAAATQTVCALIRDGRVFCWGSNERGELGQGFRDDDPHPAPVLVRF